MKNLSTTLIFIGFILSLNAQITKVKYLLSYDHQQCEYRVSLYIEEGQINSNTDRILFNSQISVVTDANVQLTVSRVYNPYIGPNSTSPIVYEKLPPAVTPANCSSYTYHRFWPHITPTAYFPEGLSAGDTLALFSFKSDKATSRCGFDIRLFENGKDPGPGDPDMLGNDFSNAFTMGSVNPLYNGNLAQEESPAPVITGLTYELALNLILTPQFETNTCSGANAFAWTGPSGFSSTNQGITIPNFQPENQGYYTLTATNKEGCENTYTIPVFYDTPSTKDTAVCAGSDLILVGSPATVNGIGGTWQSVGNAPGTLLALNQGRALLKIDQNAKPGPYTFQYTVDNNTNEINILVNDLPEIPLRICPMCEGDTLDLPTPPSMSWQSDYNPQVLDSYEIIKIIGGNQAAAVKSGTALLSLTNNITGCISKPIPVKVLSSKVSLVGNASSVCVNSTFQFLPSTGGTWQSDNPNVATINNSGVATAIAPGEVTFTYRPIVPVCGSELRSPTITVVGGPGVTFTGPTSICVGGTTTLSPTTGGTWVSANPAIATVNNNGIVTGVALGTATFAFTSNDTGCTSNLQTPVVVSAGITIQFDFPTRICIGQVIPLISNVKGTWISTNLSVAIPSGSINPKLTAVSPGFTDLIFTSTEGPCPQTITIANFQVIDPPTITTDFPAYCENSKGKIFCNFPDPIIWYSSNSEIIEIGSNNTFSAKKPGKATIIMKDSISGCEFIGPEITVKPLPLIPAFNEEIFCIGSQFQIESSNTLVGISTNPSIISVNNQGLATAIAQGVTSVAILDNTSGCLSKSVEIVVHPLEICSGSQFTAFATVFLDLDSNAFFNPQIESVLPNASINISGLNTTYFTDENGNANIKLDSGQYTFTVTMPYGLWQENPIVKTLNVNQDKDLLIGFIPQSGVISAIANQTTDFLRCNRYAKIHNTVTNTGTSLINGTMTVKLDERVYIRNITPAPIEKTDSTIVWDISQLLPGQKLKASFEAFVPNPTSNDDSLRFAILVKDDTNSSLYQNNFAHLIRCSYDPNDLQVRPDRVGEENLTLRTEALTYQVRFQNTGNDTAFYVRIDDVLHKDIDRRSLMLIDASHKGRMILCSNDTLCYIMDTIQLVDDKTNFEASQGYVVFMTKTQADIKEGTIVPNQAHIYFDSNAPVITNKVQNTIVTALPCPDNTLTIDGAWLTTGEGGLKYQWIDCNTGTVVEETTTPFYKPETIGTYQVKILGDYCTTFSECVTYNTTSTDEIPNELLIYPTLIHDRFYISTSEIIKEVNLVHLSGKVQPLMTISTEDKLTVVSLPSVTPGYYLVNIITNKGVYTKAIIKK